MLVAIAGVVAITISYAIFRYARFNADQASAGRGGTEGFSTGLTRVDVADRGSPVLLEGETLTGETLETRDWLGSVVVVNVWGSWCVPCREEAPELVGAYELTRDQGVEFVGIDVRDQLTQARGFVESFGIDYPSFFDPDGSLLLNFSGTVPVSAVPSTVVLDQQGRVAASVIGAVDETTLTGLIDDVLAEDRPRTES